MSSSSTAPSDSRSPSPLTPEASDSQDPVAIHTDFDSASSWYLSMYAKAGQMPWAPPASSYHTPHKTEDNMMLRLDELIEQDAYEDSSTDPHRYDRVGTWKWLKLPHGTATKKRTRKQGKIDPDDEDVLQLAVSVTCASPPHNRVLSCSSCQAREAKRVAKKLAARVRPARSDSESGESKGSKPGRKQHEDTTNIIQFNCAEVLDFSTGSVVLPLRITCYCRHHREKVGFNVHFTMMDHTGRLIGSGMTKPIMITDDHKTTGSTRNADLVASFTGLPGPDWGTIHSQPIPPIEARAPSRLAVWFEGFPKVEDPLSSPASLFTYLDESDRALMELALQVVGLKMTGKIEDAKNVAMRIVGTAGSDNSGSQGDNSNMMQLASSPLPSTRDLRSLLLPSSESPGLERRIVDLLSIVDTPHSDEAPTSIPISQAISYPSPLGQTLLHLAAFLGFPTLVHFLIEHGTDIDARDRNGYTALHFAGLVQSAECAKLLLEAGADREIVNSLGKTAQEVAPTGFYDDIIPTRLSDSESSDSEDEEAGWGDGEEDAAEELQMIALRRRVLRRNQPASRRATPRPSVNVSRAASPPPVPPVASILDAAQEPELNKAKEANGGEEKGVMDEKQTASFVEKMIQRTLAQLPAPQLPGLPGMVPWGALPQLPMVFPVYVPMMPMWPSFLGGENSSGDKQDAAEEPNQRLGTTAMRAAQEWRTTWEKWVALAVATTARQQQQGVEELPPPVYTAKPVDGEQTSVASTSAVSLDEPSKDSLTSRRASVVAAEIRPVGYDNHASVPAQEVDAFAYQPVAKQKQKNQKKDDRMLLRFWLPILLFSTIWALHNGWHVLYQAVKFVMPMNATGVQA
ncbi:hypothetical protein EST38_g4228 [Candolleomyces aberdarensis]|uniref:SPT23/MGA2-like DNA-binding domain-containing protein n=1 Tax=Candolleomyces aberdarensis TaxID=2316362 RepID=A0A4Q2DQD8_9AGAR|nr:hypothetical protein EST38_g4228 [Candolleomyces aberdarensis]